MILTVLCEACREEIGKINTETIGYPWKAEDFMSIDPEHNAPPPFRPGIDWEFCKCPMGNHRPFQIPNRIQTTQGYLYLDTRLFKAVSPSDRQQLQEAFDLETRERMRAMADMSVDELRAMRRPPTTEDSPQPQPNPQSSESPHSEGPGSFSFPSPAPPPQSWICEICGKEAKSKAGLAAHNRFCTRPAVIFPDQVSKNG